MTRTLPSRRAHVWDKYSPFPPPSYRPKRDGDEPSLERGLGLAARSGLPIVTLRGGLGPLPMVREPTMRPSDLDAASDEAVLMPSSDKSEDGTALRKMADALREHEALRPRGRPVRNLYLAAEVAYMIDIAGRSLLDTYLPPLLDRLGRPIHVDKDGKPAHRPLFGTWTYLGPRGQHGERLDLEEITHRTDSVRSRGVARWRDDGRRVMAALGAWPWAIAGGQGRLSRTWWREPRYAEALATWHRGDLSPG